MNIRIVFTLDARAQLIELDAWWRQNRQAAASRVDDESTRLQTLMRANPEIGRIYQLRGYKHVRWLRLHATPYRLFYQHEPGSELITIVAFWSSAHPAGPPLPR